MGVIVRKYGLDFAMRNSRLLNFLGWHNVEASMVRPDRWGEFYVPHPELRSPFSWSRVLSFCDLSPNLILFSMSWIVRLGIFGIWHLALFKYCLLIIKCSLTLSHVGVESYLCYDFHLQMKSYGELVSAETFGRYFSVVLFALYYWWLKVPLRCFLHGAPPSAEIKLNAGWHWWFLFLLHPRVRFRPKSPQQCS